MPTAYIVSALRTAGGRRNGRLSGWHPVDLAAQVLNGILDRTGVDPARIDDVILGCVMQVGEQAVNVGRNAVLASKLPDAVPGTTIDRQCGSSQQALHFAAQAVMAGSMDLVIAGGVESMTRVPLGSSVALATQAGMGGYMSPGMKQRYGDIVFSQFDGAEMLAKNYGFSRAALDAYSLESHRRAAAASQGGLFAEEVLPLPVRLADGSGDGEHVVDEGIRFDATPESIGGVKLLREGGVISAASASQICDGASAVLVASERAVKSLGAKPLARIHHLSVLGHDPVIMLEAPIPATAQALRKAGLRLEDIDLFEVNEAFASVPLAWLKATGADPAKLNAQGGAIALGHPLGASGTKLATTLLHALRRRRGRYGLQTMCEGGGMANVTIFEALH
ncbi:MAG: acetyl-CoA C-acetyltransferase [Burkholderiaceae bacterium]